MAGKFGKYLCLGYILMRDAKELKSYVAVALIPSIAYGLLQDLFAKQNQWKRQDLVDAVDTEYAAIGGLPGSQPTVFIIKKALKMMAEDGLVQNVSYGTWRSVDGPPITNSTVEVESPGDEPLNVECDIGSGEESVYLYFNPNDRKLAKLENREFWECKIGRCRGSASGRIISQGVATALSHPPVVGLIIRTDDSRALENAIHASLKLANREVLDSLGTEWFYTSPEIIRQWYAEFQRAQILLLT